jgi:hypothetical protein
MQNVTVEGVLNDQVLDFQVLEPKPETLVIPGYCIECEGISAFKKINLLKFIAQIVWMISALFVSIICTGREPGSCTFSQSCLVCRMSQKKLMLKSQNPRSTTKI